MRYFKIGDIKISNKGKYILTSCSDVSSGSVSKNEKKYIDTDGAEYSDIFFDPRIVQIDGYIMADSEHEMNSLKNKLTATLNPKKKLTIEYYNDGKIYKAEAISDALPDFGERISWKVPFSAYINICGFYWLSHREKNTKVYKVQDMLAGTFTLPCVISSKISRRFIDNDGDAECPCVFKINCGAAETNLDITIKNHTISKELKITQTVAKGEIITIDTRNCDITSSISGDITRAVAIGSDFFYLACGMNDIEIMCASQVAVDVIFNTRFLGV